MMVMLTVILKVTSIMEMIILLSALIFGSLSAIYTRSAFSTFLYFFSIILMRFQKLLNLVGKTKGRFVVRNMENNLNYIVFFLFQIIMIYNLFRDNYKVKILN